MRVMVRKAGSQFIKAELLPPNANVHASPAASFCRWELLEADLLAAGASQKAVLRAKNMLSFGEPAALIKIPQASRRGGKEG